MKAAVVRQWGGALTIEQVNKPEPGPGQVLIETEACGVCHSDLHLAEGDWPQLSKILKQPLILGHEVVGRVVDRGAGVEAPALGRRVGVPWIHWSCGECEPCREDRENLCLKQAITGATVDGGYAEYMTAPASHVLDVPENLSSVEAAPFFCAGVTVYRALRNSGAAAGDRVAIFGIGGLGHLAVQIARTFGAEVIAIDVSEDKLELARLLGAKTMLDASKADLRREFRALGGVHFAVVTSASKAAYDSAFQSLRRGGMVVVVGAPAESVCFSPIQMLSGEYRLMASSVGTRRDIREVLALAEAGKVRCVKENRPLEDINEIFDEMRKGALSGRAVLTF